MAAACGGGDALLPKRRQEDWQHRERKVAVSASCGDGDDVVRGCESRGVVGIEPHCCHTSTSGLGHVGKWPRRGRVEMAGVGSCPSLLPPLPSPFSSPPRSLFFFVSRTAAGIHTGVDITFSLSLLRAPAKQRQGHIHVGKNKPLLLIFSTCYRSPPEKPTPPNA